MDSFNFLYFLNPFIFATYTPIIAIISFTNSSSGSNLSFSLNTIIFPFEYLVINSSISSYPNLVNLSANLYTNLNSAEMLGNPLINLHIDSTSQLFDKLNLSHFSGLIMIIFLLYI